MSKIKGTVYGSLLFLLFMFALTACIGDEKVGQADQQENQFEKLPGKITLDTYSGAVLTDITLKAEGLQPNQPVSLIWNTVEGKYVIENLYMFVEVGYEDKQVELMTGLSDENGAWETSFTLPEDFGGDHDLVIYQADKPQAKTNVFIETTFSMDTTSGVVGSEIIIKGQGLSWKEYGSIWHINYDNKYTGMITAISTNGTALAKIRAAGPVGEHSITVESGAFGMPYINRIQSPHSYYSTQRFNYTVTGEAVETANFVSPLPASAAGGGVVMPDPILKKGAKVAISKNEGQVNEIITLSGTAFPVNKEATIVWNTMVGNRVTSGGFTEKQVELATIKIDSQGEFKYDLQVPDDLGGPPHLIDIVVNDEIYGQTYFQITPSIVSVTPASGPVGTEIMVEIKGVGWTEYDNIFNIVYDNAYIGYVCGFNSQGTVKFTLAATGQPGFHLIDLFPGIYKGKQTMPAIFRVPQLTYEQDHPGSRIPVLNLGFTVTE